MQPSQFQETQPVTLDADGSRGALAEFRVDDAYEVQRLLKQLRDGSVPLKLTSAQGDALGGQVWSLDTQRNQLSIVATGGDGLRLQRLAAADEAVAVGYLDNVKLQFELVDLELVHGPGGSALRAAVPTTVYRFQRRASFRVRSAGPSAPLARLRHPSLPDMTLSLRIVDLSVGGCALRLPDDIPPLQPGTRLRGVRIELDAGNGFDATLLLQHAGTLGGGGMRLGCEFHDLDGAAQRVLQRWVDHAQQRRRLLSLR